MNGAPDQNVVAGARRTREKYLGPEDTLRKMAVKIREAARDPALLPSLQQFAEAIVQRSGYPAGKHIRNEQAAQIFLDYMRANVRYRPDPPMVEFVKGAHITLCVPGATACIPVGDCDDVVVALGSLCMAYGIEVQVIAQDFGPEDDLHVLIVVKDSDGKWQSADPSHPSMPVGRRLGAKKETWFDPLDVKELKLDETKHHDAEFVAVGALPRQQRQIAGAVSDVEGMSTTAKVALGVTALAIVAGGIYIAVEHHEHHHVARSRKKRSYTAGAMVLASATRHARRLAR